MEFVSLDLQRSPWLVCDLNVTRSESSRGDKTPLGFFISGLVDCGKLKMEWLSLAWRVDVHRTDREVGRSGRRSFVDLSVFARRLKACPTCAGAIRVEVSKNPGSAFC